METVAEISQKISEAPGIVNCSYNSQFGFTKHDWITFYCHEEESTIMREALEEFLLFVKENKVTKHIVNVKHCTDGFKESDLTWISYYLVPKEVEYGIKYLANKCLCRNSLYYFVFLHLWDE
jgi:hypothetical protein